MHNRYNDEPACSTSVIMPIMSEWTCYLFGNKPGGDGLVWCPEKGCVPNFLARYFMAIFLGCHWVREKKQ